MTPDDTAQSKRPEDLFYNTYLDAAKTEDEARPKNWEGSTTGILTFTGLFAATVAAFIIESYKTLSVDSGDQTTFLLSQLLTATANASAGISVMITPPEPFSTSATSIATNALWFSSLLIALVCALLSTLVQEWSRNYVHDMNTREVLHETLQSRVYNHIYIRMGVNRYGMDQFVSWIVALVHLAVLLFALGLLIFLFPIDRIVAGVCTAVFGSFVILYGLASLLPLLDKSCPYRTPLTYVSACVYWLYVHLWDLVQVIKQDRPRSTSVKSHASFRNIVSRRYTDSVIRWQFLTKRRFVFAWEHTFPHVPEHSRSEVLRGLYWVITSPLSRRDILAYLCSHTQLITDILAEYQADPDIARSMPPHRTVDPFLFTTTADLASMMFAENVERYGQRMEESLPSSIPCISVIGCVSRIANIDRPDQTLARLCISYARSSILRLSEQAFQHNVPTLREEQAAQFYEDIRYLNLKTNELPVNAVLLLLVAGSYDGHYWTGTHSTRLLPLHDDDCCRSWKCALTPTGLAHIAACNALEIVTQLVRWGGEEDGSDPTLALNCAGGVLKPWVEYAETPDDRNPPSPEFVSFLSSVGLQEWLQPGSHFNTGPSEGPHHRFLTSTYFGHWSMKALQKLARNVDFAAYRDRVQPVSTLLQPYLSDNGLDVSHEAENPQGLPASHTGSPPRTTVGVNDTAELKSVLVEDHDGGLLMSIPAEEGRNVWLIDP
ncbi:unnamed protein product [Peniophora sp. CBMAI 1063]|nr:unnamed protein product [Peniophora sp. CBMAI 1063]